ncbi:MAG: DNA methyltransferase [Geminicoccaceae bacterium]
MRRLYYGDNLDVLRNFVADGSVDLVYLDPPFNSKRDYNILFKSPGGHGSAQVRAFTDSWRWCEESERAYEEILRGGHAGLSQLVNALRSWLGEADLMAYLVMMAVRLVELRRVLRSTGSLYLHCDPTTSHYLKLVLDAVFGPRAFVNEISWQRTTAKSDHAQGAVHFPRVRDIILRYRNEERPLFKQPFGPYSDDYVAKSYRYTEPGTGRRYRYGDLTCARGGGDTGYQWPIKRKSGGEWFADLAEEYLTPKKGWEYSVALPYKGRFWAYSQANMAEMERNGRLVYTAGGMPRYKGYLDERPGVPVSDDWNDIPRLNAGAAERLGYPTQKPLALLERIIEASSNPGDVVLDPFCGCGTALDAAEKLGRAWIGIDVTWLAIDVVSQRLSDRYGALPVELSGHPSDMEAAAQLARSAPYQFQYWTLSLIGAQCANGMKKGADGGIDGIIWLRTGRNTHAKAIVSVKGGATAGISWMRDLRAVVERESAAAGVLLCLAEPTAGMRREAAAAGLWNDAPKLQILTVEQLLAGERPRLPMADRRAGSKPARPQPPRDGQQSLGL